MTDTAKPNDTDVCRKYFVLQQCFRKKLLKCIYIYMYIYIINSEKHEIKVFLGLNGNIVHFIDRYGSYS